MLASPDEVQFKWLEAARFYEKALQNELQPESEAELWQKIGNCYELASRQALTADDFCSLRQKSVDAYEKSGLLFNQQCDEGKSAYSCALAEYTRSWFAADAEQKSKTLDKCQRLAKKASELLKGKNDLACGQASVLLARCLFERIYVSQEGKEKSALAKEGMDAAEDAIAVLSKLDAKEDLVASYSQGCIQAWYIANSVEGEEERKKAEADSVAYAKSALAVAEGLCSPYSKAFARWGAVWSNLYFEGDIDAAVKCAKEMLVEASSVCDNYLQGIASHVAAEATDMKSVDEANPDARRQLCDEVIRYSEEAIRFLSLVLQDSLIAETCMFLVDTYLAFASDFATSLSQKLVYSKKAVDVGKKGLEFAARSGSPEATITTFHGLSKALYYQSHVEPKPEYKQELLNDALCYRKEYVKGCKKSLPSNLWILGVGMVYSAQIEADLARLEKEGKGKIALLNEAINDMERGTKCCKGWIESRPAPSFVGSTAGYEDTLGGLLDESFSLTAVKTILTKANEAYLNAAEDFKKVDLPSRVAESYWKISKNSDVLGEHESSAKSFENAFASYKAAAQRISQFSDFFLAYASYMKAWSEIELAKRAHNDEKYDVAMQQYEAASQLLRQSKKWSYLSQNFYAWSLLEQAEDFSRDEKSKESIETFEKAITSLQESKRTLSTKLEVVDKQDERDLTKRLIQASEAREEYTRGRIAIEEAKLLDQKGDYLGSSDKYDRASAIFQRISLMDSEQTGREAKPLIYLCRAWQKTKLAEARASPIMYEEAADLFKLANQHTLRESTGLLTLGHSSFCRALEAGTEFEITRTMVVYEEAVRHMDAAAGYYQKAGFEAMSDYAKATRRLLDAYVLAENAKKERDAEKKARCYSSTEKVLLDAAGYFERAKFPVKAREAQEFQEKIREEKTSTMSLVEIFHVPNLTSSTASFSTAASSDESAVGLERFEHADVQAKLVQHETETKVGSAFTFEIHIVNVGKEPLSVTRIENVVPSGSQLVSKPDYCQLDGSQLTIRGKRLDSLKADEIKIALRSFKQGTVEISPRIVCLDWTGRQVLSCPEPIMFNVSGAVLPGRIPTGYADLDSLLFGGIPETYAVILESPSSDERELLIKKFLETGVKNGQTTYYITAEIGDTADLAERFQSLFTLFLCNPRADVMLRNIPNVYKAKGVESLTDIDITLFKSFRLLSSQHLGPPRICITIVSDVLLQHHAITTRKWLSGLLSELKSRGFTTLAVINPEMHLQEEVKAILSLFEGEIRISERETPIGLEKVIRVTKLYNQRYLSNEIALVRDRLEEK